MRREEGYAATELVLGVGLLLLPVAILVLMFPVWIERQNTAAVAAQEAAREAVLADDPGSATQRASAAAAEVASNRGLGDAVASVCHVVHAVGDPPPDGCVGLGDLPRGAAVTTRVTVRLPLLSFPGIGATLEAIPYTATHTERVDQYRSFPG